MKVRYPEPVNPKVLYERSLSFDYLDDEGLDLLFQGLETGLGLACGRLKRPNFRLFEFKLIFYGSGLEDFYDSPLIGRFFLETEKLKNSFIETFQKDYKQMFKQVRKDYEKMPGELNLEILVRGFMDSITKEIRTFNPSN